VSSGSSDCTDTYYFSLLCGRHRGFGRLWPVRHSRLLGGRDHAWMDLGARMQLGVRHVALVAVAALERLVDTWHAFQLVTQLLFKAVYDHFRPPTSLLVQDASPLLQTNSYLAHSIRTLHRHTVRLWATASTH
jgi:hypothetical protein